MTKHPPFAVTVDVALLTIRAGELCVLVVRRGEAPYRGRWALPGGFVRPDEDIEAAAVRELHEETGLSDGFHLEQLRTYGAPKRDPRMRTVSVAHLALAPDLTSPVAGTDAAAAEWRAVDALLSARPGLAFDHGQILADGVERARAKLEYSNLALAFVGREFTIADLRRVYETVWGRDLDAGNFHRKVTGATGLVRATGRQRAQERGRPAELFTAGSAISVHPPLTREVLR